MRDADYVFYELTRSICPECRRVIDAHILIRDNKVFMRKRCPDHGQFEALVYSDAALYTSSSKYNKPGTIPLEFSTPIANGCPHDCGLCPDHQQHACLGIIEVNSNCDMACPLCFSEAAPGFSLTLEEVEDILDHLIATEGNPQVVQFSGGEPSIHPQIVSMMRAAQARGIPNVMLNTNGKRIARDDRFLAELAEIRPNIYFQFDGFDTATWSAIRGEPDILPEKLRALDRLAEIGCTVILVPAIERGVNEHEVGKIVRFGLDHPAVKGINFQPAFHAGRHGTHDPLQRITNPDILRLIEAQTDGLFVAKDFVPVPCCFPTCNSVTYAYIDEAGAVTPLPRILNVDDYLDYITNSVMPDLGAGLRTALEGLWSSSAALGSEKVAREFAFSCSACGLPDGGLDVSSLSKFMFMIMLQDFMDPWTFNQKNLMKCCKEFLLPGGAQIPFCAYNTVGYREQARAQLMAQEPARREARRTGAPYRIEPRHLLFQPGADALRDDPLMTESAQLKSCCATAYESDFARLLLGNSFHPGGLALTERLGNLLQLKPGDHVLDVAAGKGESAAHLARTFGCSMTAIDLNASEAVLQGDAEHLDFPDSSFDALICECAFCTFPDKPSATSEFFRVLRPGGRIGLSDLTRNGPLPSDLEGLLAWIACIADARPVSEYAAYLESAGFAPPAVEPHNDALRQMVRDIEGRLLGAELMTKLKKLDLPGADFDQAKSLARAASNAVRADLLGYALLIAESFLMRAILIALSVISGAAMLYVGAYQVRAVEHMSCPLLKGGCEAVADAPFARPFGIPDGFIATALYALIIAAAWFFPQARYVIRGLAIFAALANGLGVYDMTRFGAFCFYCLLTTLLAPFLVWAAFRV